MSRKSRFACIAALLMTLAALVFDSGMSGGKPLRLRHLAYADVVEGQPFAYGSYGRILKTYVDGSGMVNYRALKAQRQDLDAFAAALGALEEKTYDGWTEEGKIAFWLNAYNALTLTAIIDNYPIRASFLRSFAYPKNSIRQIPGVWTDLEWTVMGKPVSLDIIEHNVLRAKFHEPRIHAALVCAAMSCPPLRAEPYTPDKLNTQLDDQMKRFLSDPAKFRIDRANHKVYLSPIFKWFGQDFVTRYRTDGFPGHSAVERAVLNSVSQYINPEDWAYLKTGEFSISYLDYNWSLNEQAGKAND